MRAIGHETAGLHVDSHGADCGPPVDHRELDDSLALGNDEGLRRQESSIDRLASQRCERPIQLIDRIYIDRPDFDAELRSHRHQVGEKRRRPGIGRVHEHRDSLCLRVRLFQQLDQLDADLVHQ